MARRKTRSYQQGSIVRRERQSGSVFIGRYRDRDLSGAWREKTVTLRDCPTMKAARKKLDKILKPINEEDGFSGDKPDVLFAELLESYWPNYLDSREVKPSTRSAYASLVRKWIEPFFGSMSLTDVTPRHISDFVAMLARKDLTPKYRLNIYGMVKLMLEIAVEHDLIEASPVRPKVHRPKVLRSEKHTMTPETAVAIIRHADPAYRAAISTLALTGFCAGEVLGLQWQDVDFENGWIWVRRTVWGGDVQTPKTESSNRRIGMSETLRQILTEHQAQASFSAPGDFVFSQADGRPRTQDGLRRQGIYPAMERAGIPIRKRTSGAHAFRHLAGTLVHRATGSLKLAQELLLLCYKRSILC